MNFWIEIVMSKSEVVASYEGSGKEYKLWAYWAKAAFSSSEKALKLCDSERMVSGEWCLSESVYGDWVNE